MQAAAAVKRTCIRKHAAALHLQLHHLQTLMSCTWHIMECNNNEHPQLPFLPSHPVVFTQTCAVRHTPCKQDHMPVTRHLSHAIYEIDHCTALRLSCSTRHMTLTSLIVCQLSQHTTCITLLSTHRLRDTSIYR